MTDEENQGLVESSKKAFCEYSKHIQAARDAIAEKSLDHEMRIELYTEPELDD